MPEIIEHYIEVTDASGSIVYRGACADYADAVVQWAAIRADWPGCTAGYHYHHHGDTAEPCTMEALP